MNTALKIAFIESGKTQIEVAAKLRASGLTMHETYLSKIVRGHIDPTDEEKRAIAKALRRTVHDLWPVAVAS